MSPTAADTISASALDLPDVHQTNVQDLQSILDSETAQLESTMSHEQVMEVSRLLNQALSTSSSSSTTLRPLTRLVLDESFKDLQESLKLFLSSRACAHLETLDYKSAGTSLAKILLSPSTTVSASLLSSEDPTEQVKKPKEAAAFAATGLRVEDMTEELIQTHVPFYKSIKVLKLGYNAEAPQGPEDVAILSALLRHMPQLEEFSLAQSLDDLVLFEGLAGADLSKLKKVTVTFNNECGLDEEEIESKIRELLTSSNLETLMVDLDDRESNYYLNLSRDRQFQAFLRRFTGDRNQQA
ncbi:hypothetical protein EMPS_05266 [Entomortierella parvispora]|uniref:Uncharacterized protein n=1 Tax=Entomortierella parvispora TaxID=205924 RepID=A0A9P3LWB3_9FUNG|nr:hypothetical protein EMPS_05266 [Entomortierella parvispora]